MGSKILVVIIGIVAVVPMVKLRTDHDPAQRAIMDAQIGVIYKALDPQENRKGQKGDWRESEQESGYGLKTIRENLVYRVNSDVYEPVHLLRTVMDTMKSPQPRDLVHCAMNNVSDKIEYQQDLKKL